MPTKAVKKNGKIVGYRWGKSGKLYKSSTYGVKRAKQLASRQGRAIHASGNYNFFNFITGNELTEERRDEIEQKENELLKMLDRMKLNRQRDEIERRLQGRSPEERSNILKRLVAKFGKENLKKFWEPEQSYNSNPFVMIRKTIRKRRKDGVCQRYHVVKKVKKKKVRTNQSFSIPGPDLLFMGTTLDEDRAIDNMRKKVSKRSKRHGKAR